MLYVARSAHPPEQATCCQSAAPTLYATQPPPARAGAPIRGFRQTVECRGIRISMVVSVSGSNSLVNGDSQIRAKREPTDLQPTGG